LIPDNYEKYEQFTEILQSGMKCGFCSTDLSEDDIEMYDHDGGIPVMGHLIPQWVYVVCQNQDCQYQWAWHKIITRAKAMGKVTRLG
jgi:hypothetical protein